MPKIIILKDEEHFLDFEEKDVPAGSVTVTEQDLEALRRFKKEQQRFQAWLRTFHTQQTQLWVEARHGAGQAVPHGSVVPGK